MTDLVTVRLGADGLAYLVSQLELGATFSRCLLRYAPLGAGEAVTYLPAGVSPEAARKFKEGGKLPTPPVGEWRRVEGGIAIPTPTTRDHLAGLVAKALSGPGTLCILEDPDAEPSNAGLERAHLRTALFGREVYRLLIEGSSPPELEEAIRMAQSLWLCVGAVVRAKERLPALPSHGEQFTLETLELLTQQAEMIFTGAYDGEGYVIWERMTND